MEPQTGLHSKGRLHVLPSNIRLRWNILHYYKEELITTIKSFTWAYIIQILQPQLIRYHNNLQYMAMLDFTTLV